MDVEEEEEEAAGDAEEPLNISASGRAEREEWRGGRDEGSRRR
jgi:hypothetical protein